VSGIDGIGNTPVVRLDRLTGDEDADVWVKLEAANPTGSYKDRMALAMIEAAERDGRLKPSQSVVEYSGGSTGSSLAFVCAVKGYPWHVVSSDAFASEKLRTMQAFGAEVELIPSPEGITPQLIPAMVSRARQIAAETGAFWTDQFNNPYMLDGYRQLGAELLQQLSGPPAITAFCSYVGTAGCFLGTTGTLRTKLPTLHRVVVEPAESAVLSGGVAGTHHIEGGGIGSWPPLLRREDFDEVIAVSDAAPSPWPGGPLKRKASSPDRRLARISSPPYSLLITAVLAVALSLSRSTAASSTSMDRFTAEWRI
jgi:cysteine synthase A